MRSPNLRILCVDDDEDTSELINMMLQRSNAEYKITSVKTPDEALTLAATKEFDLYVLDYRYADTTGVEICRRIRQTDRDTPIMFFTGEAHAQERQMAIAAGANAYLIKPDDLDKLTDTVKLLLGAEKLAART